MQEVKGINNLDEGVRQGQIVVLVDVPIEKESVFILQKEKKRT